LRRAVPGQDVAGGLVADSPTAVAAHAVWLDLGAGYGLALQRLDGVARDLDKTLSTQCLMSCSLPVMKQSATRP
jgi:hypothetical protein